MKVVEENDEKVFTKNVGKDIIFKKEKESYNRYFYEREGLVMKKTKDIVLKEIIKGLNWREKIIVRIFPKTVIKVYRKGMAECFNYFNK